MAGDGRCGTSAAGLSPTVEPASSLDGFATSIPNAEALDRLARSLEHVLRYRLEGFSNGQSYPPSNPSNKTNGYVAAKVPDWQLRQWLALVHAARGIMTATADETRSGSVERSEIEPGPQDAPEPSPCTPTESPNHD